MKIFIGVSSQLLRRANLQVGPIKHTGQTLKATAQFVVFVGGVISSNVASLPLKFGMIYAKKTASIGPRSFFPSALTGGSWEIGRL
ncbi:MAG: hypothetical protein CFE32_20795 [Alphaproteobacteria bacterium PA3]|nr:MAG: hypothetical protein CFE32_20795 [Alphaproteobacteria bacterium PA3]